MVNSRRVCPRVSSWTVAIRPKAHNTVSGHVFRNLSERRVRPGARLVSSSNKAEEAAAEVLTNYTRSELIPFECLLRRCLSKDTIVFEAVAGSTTREDEDCTIMGRQAKCIFHAWRKTGSAVCRVKISQGITPYLVWAIHTTEGLEITKPDPPVASTSIWSSSSRQGLKFEGTPCRWWRDESEGRHMLNKT